MKCDRQLSRAVRQILIRDTLPILLHHLPTSPSPVVATTKKNVPHDNNDEDLNTLIAALVAHLPSSAIHDNKCLLDPRRDMTLKHELNSQHSTPNRSSQRRKRRRGKDTLSTCAICGKSFYEPFYLDWHMEHAHANDTILDFTPATTMHGESIPTHDPEGGYWLCPATELCPAFSHLECQRVASLLDPHYHDRRDGGSIRPPLACNEQDMEQSRRTCQELLDDCFSTTNEEMVKELKEHVCGVLSCQHHLHSLAAAADNNNLLKRHVHHWRQEWQDHHPHGVGGFGGVVFITLFLLFYGLIGCIQWWETRKRRMMTRNTRIIGGGYRTTQKKIDVTTMRTKNNQTDNIGIRRRKFGDNNGKS